MQALWGGSISLVTPCSPHAGAVARALEKETNFSIGDVIFRTSGLSEAGRSAAAASIRNFIDQHGCALGGGNACPAFRLRISGNGDAEVVRCTSKAFKLVCGTRLLDVMRGLREASIVGGVDYGDLSVEQRLALAKAVRVFSETHSMTARVSGLVWSNGIVGIKECAVAGQ
jgi:hypothetical protein